MHQKGERMVPGVDWGEAPQFTGVDYGSGESRTARAMVVQEGDRVVDVVLLDEDEEDTAPFSREERGEIESQRWGML
jgi:hypothetical protein